MDFIQNKYSISLSKNTSQVWVDPVYNLLLIEYKRENPHSISLRVIDYKKGTKFSEDILISQDTFITIEHIKNGIIIIQKYSSSSHQLPIPIGLLFYSTFEKKIIGECASYRFISSIDNEIIISEHQFENIVYKKIDLATPLKAEEALLSTVFELSKRKNQSVLIFPQLYLEGDSYFQDVFSFLLEKYSLRAQHIIYYLEYPPFILVSCYIWEENQEKNIFMIINIEKEYFQKEYLLPINEKTSNSSFFMIGNQLFIINNKNQLISYEL